MDNDLLQAQLESMGFPRAAAIEAIQVTRGRNLDAAIEYIITKGDSFEQPSPRKPDPPKAQPKSDPKSEPKPDPKPASKSRKDLEDSDFEDDDEDQEFIEDEDMEEEEEQEQVEDEEEEVDMIIEDTMMSTNSNNKAAIEKNLIPIAKRMELKGIFILTSNDIRKAVDREIEKVSNMFEISTSNSTSLLLHFKWDSERLVEKYFENPDKVMKEAGIVKEEKPQIKGSFMSECEICAEEFKQSQGTALSCGHNFCNDCWAGYLKIKIVEGNVNVGCMGMKCPKKVPPTLIKEIVPQLYQKYENFLIKSFVEDNQFMKWCPGKECQNGVKCDLKSEWEVNCTCGFKFCFKCSEEAHVPADCSVMKEWFKKCQDDSETGNWLQTNTKDCPKCRTAIEKNGGCNHMTCRKCSHEFCWICFGNWKTHSNCNAYKEDPKISEARSALERYLHYFNRYNIHEQSKKLEQNLRASTMATMLDLQEQKSLRWVEVQYLEAATEQLIECRRTLKYTYVYAFFMKDGPEKTLFEYLQAQLETETENLSGLLERTGVENLLNMKKRVMEVTTVASKRLDHLIEGVKNGLIEDSGKLKKQEDSSSNKMFSFNFTSKKEPEPVTYTTNTTTTPTPTSSQSTKPTKSSSKKNLFKKFW